MDTDHKRIPGRKEKCCTKENILLVSKFFYISFLSMQISDTFSKPVDLRSSYESY